MNDNRAMVEQRLEALQALRASKVAAARRRRGVVIGVIVLLAALIGVGLTLVDLREGGMSARNPIYWLVGLVGLAALPIGWLALSRPPEATGDAALDIDQIDAVIAQVKTDLKAEALVAPEASLAVVEADASGRLAEVE